MTVGEAQSQHSQLGAQRRSQAPKWLEGLTQKVSPSRPRGNSSSLPLAAQSFEAQQAPLEALLKAHDIDGADVETEGFDIHEKDGISSTAINNLGGKGPDFGSPPILLWSDVCEFEGHPIDLMIQNVSKYESYSMSNGNNGEFGLINVKADSFVDLKFTFWNRDEERPQKLKDFVLAVLDIDINSYSREDRESVLGGGFEYTMVAPKTTLLASEMPDGRLVFSATYEGNTADNPRSVEGMTKGQLQRSVAFIYNDVESFVLTLMVGKGQRGRNFMFAGRTQLMADHSPHQTDSSVNSPAPLPEVLSRLADGDPDARLSSASEQQAELQGAARVAALVMQVRQAAVATGSSIGAVDMAGATAAAVFSRGGSPEAAARVGASAAQAMMSGATTEAARAIGPAAGQAAADGKTEDEVVAAGIAALQAVMGAGQSASDMAKAANAPASVAGAAMLASSEAMADGLSAEAAQLAGSTAMEMSAEGFPEAAAVAGSVAAAKAMDSGASPEVAAAVGQATAVAMGNGAAPSDAVAAGETLRAAVAQGASLDSALAESAGAMDLAEEAQEIAREAGQTAAAAAVEAGATPSAVTAAQAAAVEAIRDGRSPSAAVAAGEAAKEGIQAGLPAFAAAAAGKAAAEKVDNGEDPKAAVQEGLAGWQEQAAKEPGVAEAGEKAESAAVAAGAPPAAVEAAKEAAQLAAEQGLSPEAAEAAGEAAKHAVELGLGPGAALAAGVGASHAAQVGRPLPEAAQAGLAEWPVTAATRARQAAASAAHASGSSPDAVDAAQDAAAEAAEEGYLPKDSLAAGAAAAVVRDRKLPTEAAAAAGRVAARASADGAPLEEAVAAGVDGWREAEPISARQTSDGRQAGHPMGIPYADDMPGYKCAEENEPCYCRGEVYFGGSESWSSPRIVASSVQCSENIFGSPSGMASRVCFCRALGGPTKKIWWPPYAVGGAFIVIHTGLAIMRGNLGDAQPGRWLKTFEASLPALPFAPMICAVMLMVALRGEQLGGHPLVVSMLQSATTSAKGSQWWRMFESIPQGCKNFVGAPTLVIPINIAAWTFIAQVLCRLIAKWHVWPYADRYHMPPGNKKRRAQFWFNLWNILYTAMILSVLFLLFGLFVLMRGESKALRNIPEATAPNAATKLCIAALVIAYVGVHVTSHVLTFVMMNQPFSIALMRRLAINMELVPMVCSLFLGAQLVANAVPMELSVSTGLSMYSCTACLLVQVLLAMAQPFIFGYTLEILGQWDLEKAGEPDIIVRPGPWLFSFNCCRWLVLFGGYVSSLQVAMSLWWNGQRIKTPSADIHLILLVILVAIYFVTEAVRLCVAVKRYLKEGTSWSVALPALGLGFQLFMDCCPIMAFLIVAHWCQVSFR
eukprot:CAMPEP_0170591512 /NCGR_PEP_ID=MMETSP0224-20130122/12443_1 /TAXON_ID=285029 /ORGANISM="Togula jolla, Strain CCCM 725" /LENGTH=1369 /DNA_ID=CAMNT_0010915381 /DNA_START=257 /DNA_END=4366 /DNA_ORIENTATION=-